MYIRFLTFPKIPIARSIQFTIYLINITLNIINEIIIDAMVS